MTYSKKLEDIPKAHLEDLRTFLSELKTSDAKQTRVSTAARETKADSATVQTVFSELTQLGVLRAKVEVRCPVCETHHGDFSSRSAVPNETKRCFVCDEEFQMDNQSCWEVVYELSGNPADFFPDDDRRLRRYVNEGKDIPPSYFREELERLRDMEDEPQSRGRQFDHFMGLLFSQLPEVEVTIQDNTKTGEIDVYISCLEAPRWIVRLVGNGTLIENKWQQNPVETGEISKFHNKAKDLPFPCYIAYFVSMSGFSSKGGTGAISKLKSCRNPSIVDLDEEDVIDMVKEGTPDKKIKERELG